MLYKIEWFIDFSTIDFDYCDSIAIVGSTIVYALCKLPYVWLATCSADYWGDFDYCDSIAIVGSCYCDSCDTIAILSQ